MSGGHERPVSPTGSTKSARWDTFRNRLRVGGSSLDDEELAARYSYELEFGSADQFYVDIRPKKVTIEDVVHNEKVLEALREFSKSEHTEENLCFLHDVIQYKKVPSTEAKRQIIDHYFAKNAVMPVNVSYDVRERILRQATIRPETAEKALFDDAWEEVESLVRQDILVRYNAQMDNTGKRKILNPAWHGRMVLVFQIVNIFFFIVLAALTISSTVYMREMHKRNTVDMLLLENWRTNYIEARVALYTYVTTGDPRSLTRFYEDFAILKDAATELTTHGVFVEQQGPLFGFVAANQYQVGATHKEFRKEMQKIMVERMQDGNQTAALDLLRSVAYEKSWTLVAQANAQASKIILGNTQHETDVLNTFSAIGIAITCVALLYSIPSACVLVAAERRRAKQTVRLTKMLNRRLQEMSEGDAQKSSTNNLLPKPPSPQGPPTPVLGPSIASLTAQSRAQD